MEIVNLSVDIRKYGQESGTKSERESEITEITLEISERQNMNRQIKPLLRFLLCFLLIYAAHTHAAGLNAHATSISQAEQEKADAEKSYEEAGKAIDNLEENRENTQSEAEGLDGELISLLVDLSLLEDDIADMKVQIRNTDKEYQEARKRQEQQYELMKKRIQFLYEQGRITYLDILLKAKGIGDLVRETEYTRQLYEYDRDMILDYEDIRQEVLAKKERLEQQQSEMVTMKQEYTAQKAGLEEAIEVKKAQLADFDARLVLAKQHAEEAAKVIQEKTEEIRRLRAEEEQRKRAEEAQRQMQRQAALLEDAARRSKGPGYAPYKSTGGTEFGRSVADYALQFVGNPYVWGGTSLTNGADCSGFTQSVYRHFGVSIPRTSGEQAKFGKEIAYEDMEPGDLICYSGHVSMYIGDGRIVHAASAKAGICVTDDPAYRTIVSIRRPWQ